MPDGPIRIALFGPESTGKSRLAERLALHFKSNLCGNSTERPCFFNHNQTVCLFYRFNDGIVIDRADGPQINNFA